MCTETFQWEPSEGFHLVAATSLNLSAIYLSVCMAECICAVQLCVCVCSCYFIYQTLHQVLRRSSRCVRVTVNSWKMEWDFVQNKDCGRSTSTLCWEANCKVSTKRSENTVTENSPFIHTGEVTRTKTIFNSIKMPIDTLRYHYKVNVVTQCRGYRIMTPSAFDWFAIKLAFTMRLCLPPGTKWSLAWFYLLLCLHDRLTERINTFVPCCW